MKNTFKQYKMIGLMTGTSMDGLDCSYLETNGDDFVKIIKEKTKNNLIKKGLLEKIFGGVGKRTLPNTQ